MADKKVIGIIIIAVLIAITIFISYEGLNKSTSETKSPESKNQTSKPIQIGRHISIGLNESMGITTK